MYKIIEVNNKKLLKKFVNYPLKLYKDCPYFVPALYSDEMNALDPKTSVHQGEDATVQCFLCVDENEKIVGRACGIISHLYNKKNNDNRMRISRFDLINDIEVANTLLSAVEDWGRKHGVKTIHGPLGFNDLEREGLLIEGFDEMCTFESQYNYPYYKELLEQLGYVKEVDWIEMQVPIPSQPDERNARLAEAVSKRLKVKEAQYKNLNDLLKKYYEPIMSLIDETYGILYGTVPITKRVRDSLLGQFKLVLNKDLISILVDEEDNVIGFGLIFPAINKGVHKAKGRLFPFGWIPVLRSLHQFETVDFALIGVKPEYQDKGITSIIFSNLITRMAKLGVKIAESNLQLEENYKIQKLFDVYKPKIVRRRRCYVKSLNGEEIHFAKCVNRKPKEPKSELIEPKQVELKEPIKKEMKKPIEKEIAESEKITETNE